LLVGYKNKKFAAHQIAGAHVTSPAMNAFGILQARAIAQLGR